MSEHLHVSPNPESSRVEKGNQAPFSKSEASAQSASGPRRETASETQQKISDLTSVMTQVQELGPRFADLYARMQEKKAELELRIQINQQSSQFIEQASVQTSHTASQETLELPRQFEFTLPDTERIIRGNLGKLTHFLADGHFRNIEEMTQMLYGEVNPVMINRTYAQISNLGRKVLPETPYSVKMTRVEGTHRKLYSIVREGVENSEMRYDVQEQEPVELKSTTLQGADAVLYKLMSREEGVTAEQAAVALYGEAEGRKVLAMRRLLRLGRVIAAENSELELESPGMIKTGEKLGLQAKGLNRPYRLRKKSDVVSAELSQISNEKTNTTNSAIDSTESASGNNEGATTSAAAETGLEEPGFVGSLTRRDIEYLAAQMQVRRKMMERIIHERSSGKYSAEDFGLPQDVELIHLSGKWNVNMTLKTAEEHAQYRTALAQKLATQVEEEAFLEDLLTLEDQPENKDAAGLLKSLLNMQGFLFGKGSADDQAESFAAFLLGPTGTAYATDRFGWVRSVEDEARAQIKVEQEPEIAEAIQDIPVDAGAPQEQEVSLELTEELDRLTAPALSEEEQMLVNLQRIAMQSAGRPKTESATNEEESEPASGSRAAAESKSVIEKKAAQLEVENILEQFIAEVKQRIEACDLPYAKLVVKDFYRKISLNQWGMIGKHTGIGIITGRTWQAQRGKFSQDGSENNGSHTMVNMRTMLVLLAQERLVSRGSLKRITPKELERIVESAIKKISA